MKNQSDFAGLQTWKAATVAADSSVLKKNALGIFGVSQSYKNTTVVVEQVHSWKEMKTPERF